MSQREAYEPGVPCWVETLHTEPEVACRFYEALFGWGFAGPGQMPGHPPGGYFVARLRGRDVAGVGSQPASGDRAAPAWSTHVFVVSADGTAQAASRAGGTVVVEPFDALPAGRLSVLADPEGATLCAWEPRARKGAQLVNEPGAWSMSTLAARDPERAAAFYSAVFGWTTERIDLGGTPVTLFRLPGYVGGEPEQPVSRETVATMVPAGAGVTPRWTVDFWVKDAHEAARESVELGGSVILPPFAVPIGWTAELADPAGASFWVTAVTGRK